MEKLKLLIKKYQLISDMSLKDQYQAIKLIGLL
jgi:hypothetical protein